MRLSDFHYELPAGLIAQRPPEERGSGRLLCLDRAGGGLRDSRVRDFSAELRPGDLLVFNDTRVIKARLHGRKASGGQVEVLVERVLEDRPGWALVHLRASKSSRPGTCLHLAQGAVQAEVGKRVDNLFELRFAEPDVLAVLERHGEVPLPPYIGRSADAQDLSRYQSIFARSPGAIAAPTASLHFDAAHLERLRDLGLQMDFVTLHVGAGTFQPVRSETVAEHRMHAERVEVGAALCERIRQARAQGGRIVAIGTTVMRALESAALQVSDADPERRVLEPLHGETRLFITPGFRFRVVDALFTNFHLPESTLLMLVCAFGGHQPVMRAYRHAVEQGYRFFSYGDAMWIA